MDSPGDVTLVPHTTIRKQIARHMVASRAEAAHAYAMIDVDYTAVDEVRRSVGPRWREEHGYSLSFLPFVARAVALAVERFPQLNARFRKEGLELRHEIGLGIAVDLDFEGLVVPVIPRAHQLDVPAIARAIDDLARRARTGGLTGQDVTGGTFTVSNPGPFGARTTLPIINPHQVAILTVDAIAARPAVVPDGEDTHALAIRPIGNLTLAWDHRAFDGAYATSALTAIRAALQTHDWASEVKSWNAVPPSEHAVASA
ncbi:2-oxo acid dehydrogenase subunit E2 [Saccharopolyspora sp. 5N708]|uniref:2-oxo acid dehydrogenase subunit E2 n=1 Tax=Saccharopolyspora sp. 5N708 TaxID=3457424 RepID=UPI003FD13ABD